MYHLQKAFENSLRCGSEFSPRSSMRSAAGHHRACRGVVHACGNYSRSPTILPNGCSDSPVNNKQCTPEEENGHNSKPARKNSKTSSVSSEGHSGSDSLDSLSDRTLNGSENGGYKTSKASVVQRLHSTATKASSAKTAKMRYLEEEDEENARWMQELRREAHHKGDEKNAAQKEKRQKRRDRLKKVLNDKIALNGADQGKNGVNGDVSNGVVEAYPSEFLRRRRENLELHSNVTVRPPWNSNKTPANFFRNSFRRSFRRNYKNVKTVTLEEVISLSEKKKHNVVGSEKKNCLKDLEELMLRKCSFNGVDVRVMEAKSEEQVATEKQWLDAERVWLVHRGGFVAARKDTSANLDAGKLRIRLEHKGDILDVDEDDLEKANPPQFDRAEDLSTLRQLNESSLLHTLRQRYATNLIHTYAGNSTLLIINPMAPLAIYSEKVIALFKGCKSEDMPPHIYSMAQSAYHNMLSSRRDQSIAFLGRSGSGKTTNFRHSIQYLVTAAGTVNKILTVEKLTSIWTVLESFGNCKTVMNTNATRFTQIFSLDFDQSGVVASASIQILMLEKSRVARKVDSESTFHIMYRLLSGVEGNLRKELFLENMSGNESNAFMTLLQKHEDKQRAQAEFVKVCNALSVLDVTEQEQRVVWSVLAAVFHLGCAGATKGNTNNRYQFVNPQSAQRAAHLLGTTVEELSRVIFGLASGGMGTPNAPRAPFRTPSPTDKGLDRDVVGLEALEGMIIGLYAEVFNCVASLINRSISASMHTVTSLLLIDMPGFQNPASCGKQTGASFEDLCHNYLQERLQLLFHHTNLVAPRDRYLQENIDLPCEENENDNIINPLPLINLLDKTAQSTVIRTSQTDLHENDRRGLLWLLDEEAIYPGSSDESFLERLFTHFGDRDHQLLLRKAPGNNQFILQHLQGTNPVLYSCNGWLKYSRENPVSRSAVTILQDSCKEELSKLFVGARGLGASSFSGSVVGIEGSQSLRRASSIRRTFTTGTAGIKRKSVCLQTKFTVDGLIETLRRTKLRFVHCILPQHNAGYCETNTTLLAVKSASNQAEDNVINVPLLRSQIRGAQILESVRLYKQGFPHFLPLSEFRRRFQLLASDFKPKSPVMDERKTVEDMLLCLDLELSGYRIGLSQIETNPKLRSAIDNFDKILDEYSATQKPRPLPKLQKSRTCSIIESKCILKTNTGGELEKKSSRSLENLTQLKSNHDTKKKPHINKPQAKRPQVNNSQVNKPQVNKPQVNKPQVNKSQVNKPQVNKPQVPKRSTNGITVKEVVQKINSMTDCGKEEKVRPKEETKPGPKLSLAKALSSLDISSPKKCFASKIPVKSSLNRSFPSTPTGLNILLDRKLGSTQNLAGSRLDIGSEKNLHKAESAQNLRSIGQAKPSNKTHNLSSKTFRVQRMVKANSVHNLGSKFAKTDLTLPPVSKPRMENSVQKKKHEETVTNNKPPKKLVTSVVQKLESDMKIEKNLKPKFNSDTYRKAPTFGSEKSQFEPKFIETSPKKNNSKKVELQKLESVKQSSTQKYSKKSWTHYEKVDLKKARELVDSVQILTCESLNNKSYASLIVEDLFDKAADAKDGRRSCSNYSERTDIVKFEQLNNKLSSKSSEALIGDEVICSAVKDYASDDNSEDSGNISNEHIADLSSLTSSSRNNSVESLPSIGRNNLKNNAGNVIYNNLNSSLDRSIDEEIFFRSGVLTQLETQRDERLAGMVVNLQSHCRGYLARKKLGQRKLQDLAVRCIQRNVRKFMVVRDWPWWRLLVRVTPLLNVHRTEEELKNKTEELEVLRAKVEKLETERTSLKHENDKLEAKLTELTTDLAEEHSTSTLAAERLDAETSERMRIERELSEVQNKNKVLRDSSERLEMELLYAKSELNGIAEEEEDGESDGGIYKQRYERAKKELEFTKRRLQQQHEDDLEQLVGLKKQLEKKLTDAYEEVEEQRQVVGQWKRKVQKLNGETNDLRLLLEEQNARNNLLEKKQRKFDAETQLLQDELRQEKVSKERLAREKEQIIAEKFTLESSLADTRLELDLKDDKLQALQRELDELTYGGKTEEEVTILRKQKIDCERRLHEQDEELDELAGQVQLLEQAKLRLEMSLESQRKEGKREAQQRDDELEEVRCNAQKKVKALEAQLENEHEERTSLLREKHELERRLTALAESDRNDRAGDEALLHKLKRDLKRTKALLRDTQSQLERLKADSPGKALIRQLRNQIEDLECARSVAVKSKQSLEADLLETQASLEESNKQKSDVEDRINAMTRERSDLQAQLEENEEELAEVMKKYKAAVQQMSLDQITLQEQVSLVSELETERNNLRDQLAELASKLESVENMGEASSNLHLKRMELKTKELESKLELEQTTRSRLEVQIARLKEAVEKLQTEVSNARTKEQAGQEQVRKLQRSLRELKEEHNGSLSKETEFVQKRKDLEKRCELAETETAAAKADLKLALKRIEDLQSAIQGELEDTNSEQTDSEQDSYTSDESVSTFLSNSKLSSTLKSERNSVQFDSRRLSNASRSSTSSSMHGKDYSYA